MEFFVFINPLLNTILVVLATNLSDFVAEQREKDLSIDKLVIPSVHPETPIKIPKLKLWTPNNGHLGIQTFRFGSVSGWTLPRERVYIPDDIETCQKLGIKER